MGLVAANHYELDGAVSGVVDIFGLSGQPVVSLTVGEHTVSEAELRETAVGFEITAQLAAIPDESATYLVLLLPRVNVDESPVHFTAVLLLVTVRTSIGGPDFVSGVVQHYDSRHVHGTASVVKTAVDEGARRYQA